MFLGTGASYLPKDERLIERWKKVLAQSPLLAVRGKHSKQALDGLGFDAKICGDLGYLLNLEIDKPATSEDYIVITPRSIRPTIYELYEGDFELRRKLADVIDSCLEAGIKIIVYSVSVDDYSVIRGWVKKWQGRVEYKEYNGDFEEYCNVLSKAKVLMSMRMHPGIFALSLGVMPIELDKRVKFRDSFSLFDDPT